MFGYYCYANEIDGTLTCYYINEVCTYYPDGSVICVPRASAALRGNPVVTLILIILFLIAIYWLLLVSRSH